MPYLVLKSNAYETPHAITVCERNDKWLFTAIYSFKYKSQRAFINCRCQPVTSISRWNLFPAHKWTLLTLMSVIHLLSAVVTVKSQNQRNKYQCCCLWNQQAFKEMQKCQESCSVAHHDDLYGDRHRQLGFKSLIYLLYDEHHHHDHDGDHHITHIGGGDLVKDDLQGLKNETSRWTTCWMNRASFKLACTYIYEWQRPADPWNFQPQHKLELRHQNVDRSSCGETWHKCVGKVHDNEAHLQNAHHKLPETGVTNRFSHWGWKTQHDKQNSVLLNCELPEKEKRFFEFLLGMKTLWRPSVYDYIKVNNSCSSECAALISRQQHICHDLVFTSVT